MRARRVTAFLVQALLLTGCAGAGAFDGTRDLVAAEAFIDAFYSFNGSRLRSAMKSAPSSIPSIAFYQGWAEGGHYEVVKRAACSAGAPNEVACAITVKDDFIQALGLPEHVTDTFHLTFSGGRIVRVRTTSNDPALFEEALQWVQTERPEVVAGPCRGFFAGGPTPQACAQAVSQGFREFAASRRQ